MGKEKGQYPLNTITIAMNAITIVNFVRSGNDTPSVVSATSICFQEVSVSHLLQLFCTQYLLINAIPLHFDNPQTTIHDKIKLIKGEFLVK